MEKFLISVGLFALQCYVIFWLWNAVDLGLPPMTSIWQAYGLMTIARYLLPPRKKSDD